MAIKDIQQQLIKSEGQSGEFLIKKIKADLNAIYNAGYGDETSPLLDSYWDQALREFTEEASRAVKKGKSKEAREILKDLEVFQKSLEATAEIQGSGIAAGTLAMLLAVKPHILTRAKTLSKNEGIFKSMRKKAVSSAAGAVEGFASNLLAPLPFGAGEAIIGKTKGLFGAGKGDTAARRAEQAVSFAGRIERGGEIVGTEGGGAAGNGGVAARGEDLGETNEILKDILVAVKPDKETEREEERESDRQHKETIRAMKAGGLPVTADGADGDGGGGFLSSFLASWLGGGKGKGGIKNLFKSVGGVLLTILGGKIGLIAAVIAGVGAGLWALFTGEDEDPHPDRLEEQAHKKKFQTQPQPETEKKEEKKEEGGFFKMLGFQEGGKVPGPKGEKKLVMAHGEEIFFDNESSERMERVARLLEGTDFKNMKEFFTAGKSSAGFNILMDKFFTSGMLESKHGGMLKNTAMLFGLAGHGQMGKKDFLGRQIDEFSMGPETVMKLFERLAYFKGRERGEVGSKRRKNMDELNALRAIQEISKSMALWGDSPEELAAIKRWENMTTSERMLDQAPREVWEERGKRLQIDLQEKWETFRKNEAGRTLMQNASARASFQNRVGGGGAVVINDIKAPTNNATIMPERTPRARHPKVSGETMDRLIS